MRTLRSQPRASRCALRLGIALMMFSTLAFAQDNRFRQLCAGCHGAEATGGDRAPSLTDNRSLRARTVGQIRELIRTGTRGGMPAFPLPDGELDALAKWVHSLNASAYEAKPSGNARAGQLYFFGEGKCASCHMIHGRGQANGPDLSLVGRQLTVHEIEQALIDPTGQMGLQSSADCPGWAFCSQELWAVVDVHLRTGSQLRGFARSRGKHDLQVQTFDGKLHSLTDAEYDNLRFEKTSYMPPVQDRSDKLHNLVAYLSTLGDIPPGPIELSGAPSLDTAARAGEWATYNGEIGGNRYSKLDEIKSSNVNRLQLQWSYSLPNSGLETTPLVKEGMMFVTGPNEICVLDARTGRGIWCYLWRSGSGEKGHENTSQPNRGVALQGDRVFFATDDAHLICLNRLTGALMWDVVLPETPGRYSATSPPLVVGDLVICGIAGGDSPLRGFLAAYRAATGDQVWRFWTVPRRGEPGSETWKGKAIETGGGATWLTGSYDAETDTLFWTAGNPFPATDGEERVGSNLYTNCVLALNPRNGILRWYFQFTPHDLHDWDATEPLVLVDAEFHGRPRKLLLQANRSGFFYILDRTNGEFLLAKPFVRDLNWASEINADGKPRLLPANQPTTGGIKGCPAVRGATNWYSTAFNPGTKLFYVMAVEDCSIYRQSQLGGYGGYHDPQNPGQKFLRALKIESGEIAWEIPQIGVPEANYSGVLTTAGSLVFYGETGGSFAAVQAETGECLWHFNTGVQWKASPMTYSINGKQYVAIASGSSILSFALPS